MAALWVASMADLMAGYLVRKMAVQMVVMTVARMVGWKADMMAATMVG
jgi:2-keto-4-pentenoate hydratase